MVSSLLMSFAPATVRVYATTAKGASGSAKEEKNPLDFVLGFMTKQDQFYETDPILKKVEEKEGTTGSRGTGSGGTGSRGTGSGGTGSRGTGSRGTVRGGKTSAPTPVPPKKNDGGFGGLFSKK